jgi:CheY-like chemotaxis protein
MTPTSPVNVLIVDDSRADAQLTQLWLRNSTWVRDMQVARTGQEALSRLRREPPFDQIPPPQLILLDLNLPDTLGFDLLASLQHDDQLARIPVIVLTGTIRDSEIQRAQQLGAIRCLCKPFDADEFTKLVEEVEAVIRANC